jgi:hypothetical protein
MADRTQRLSAAAGYRSGRGGTEFDDDSSD